tara:strand:+ start:7327 stop:7716 length:390 start_codon:yes stop_codon:yes gene_type:complete
MQNIYIQATEESPEIIFDLEKSIFSIKGKSVVSDVENFYNPVLDWLSEVDGELNENVSFVFDFEYFNISSSKRILFILYKLNDLRKTGKDIRVIWNFSKEDDEMREVGEDYAVMVNVPFEFISKTDVES